MAQEDGDQKRAVLELSPAEERAVHDEVWDVIYHTLECEDAFNRNGASVDRKTWKQVRANDNLRVYKHRKQPTQNSFESSRETFSTDCIAAPELLSPQDVNISSGQWRMSLFSNISGSSGTSESSVGEDPTAPELLCVGYVEGDVNDLTYGAYDGDDVAWRIRSTYLRDKLADARFLARIETPTDEEPFRFLGVKWFAIEYPPVVGSFIAKRDTLVIEATGTAVDQRGMPYSYYALQDFKHPILPEKTAPNVVRIHSSFCFISRQVTPERIAVYARGRMDVGGDLMKSVGLAIASISIASTANAVETSYNKKLVWLMAQQETQRRLTLASPIPGPVPACDSCLKPGGGILARGLTNCQVCGHIFCSKCSVTKKLVVDVTEGSLRPLTFCFGCVLEAKQLSPVQVARATLVKNP
ncbi:hypothetical protein Poli38472_012593 [Pythium oligandrum]|uniref:FYVE-type domain-containing protein n=1 Tax=Pythium oligandrum TaxID=41045 RepID=A0A8K1CDQ8_PYTOL|nr:hypothetical protein Poli38472_012593 [Pythium oligandrum]|eukprot:TMW61402.1 hypothetical protein Poli38472_012593 [Pythium oligandrum]